MLGGPQRHGVCVPQPVGPHSRRAPTSQPLRNPDLPRHSPRNSRPPHSPRPPTRSHRHGHGARHRSARDTATRAAEPTGGGVTCGEAVGPARRSGAEGQVPGLHELRGSRPPPPPPPPPKHGRQRRRAEGRRPDLPRRKPDRPGLRGGRDLGMRRRGPLGEDADVNKAWGRPIPAPPPPGSLRPPDPKQREALLGVGGCQPSQDRSREIRTSLAGAGSLEPLAKGSAGGRRWPRSGS